MDAMTAQARRFYHHVHHGGSLKESDVAAMVRAMEGKAATIARLTAERDEARASAAAAYEKAAVFLQTHAYAINNGVPEMMPSKFADMDTHHKTAANAIRALATEAETSALAEFVKKALDAETRRAGVVISEECHRERELKLMDAILARLGQPKADSVE